MLKTIKTGESLFDNKYEDLPPQVQREYTEVTYKGAQYHEYPDQNTAVLMVKSDDRYDRWQKIDGVWQKT